MLRYATELRLDRPGESDMADQQPLRLRFRLWHVLIAVGVVCAVLAQIGWWLNHPLDRELFKLGYGAATVRGSAAVALGEMGSDAETAVPALIDAMNDHYQYDYATALSKIGTVRALIAILDYEPPLYPNPLWPVPALGQHGPEAREAVPVLIHLLQEPERVKNRKSDIIEALAQIGPDAKSAIPVLIDIADNPTDYGLASSSSFHQKCVGEALHSIGLEYLKEHANINALHLSSSGGQFRWLGQIVKPTRLTDNDLVHLKGLAELRKLDLRGDAITDAGLEHLQGMTNLEKLWLGGSRTPITDKGLAHLQGLTSLKDLEIWSTHVTDLGIEHLKGLTSLESSRLVGTKVTDDGIEKLQQGLPNCVISQ